MNILINVTDTHTHTHTHTHTLAQKLLVKMTYKKA